MKFAIAAWRAWCARIADRRMKRGMGWTTGWGRARGPSIF